MQNFIYLIGDRNTHECVMVDPAWDVASVLKAAEADGMKVIAGLATHYHHDHTNGLEDLFTKAGCKAYVNKHDAPYLKGMKDYLEKVDSGFKLKVGNVEIEFLHTPGHTPGSQCFLVNNRLVSGDTLFINACGRCDLPGGSAAAMYESLKRLSELDDSTILYPGHNYADEPTSTIGKEKHGNPYMKKMNLDHFLQFRMGW